MGQLCVAERTDTAVEPTVTVDARSRLHEPPIILALDAPLEAADEPGFGFPSKAEVCEVPAEAAGEPDGGPEGPREASLADGAGPAAAAATQADGIGVPWYRAGAGEGRGGFIHAFYTRKALSADGRCYVLHAEGEQVQFSLAPEVTDWASYPPPTYDRRLTLNNWRDLLTESMLLAGLRLAALQANLQVVMALFDNPAYAGVPSWVPLAWLGVLAAALAIWALLGARAAYLYRGFVHPDSRLQELAALASSTLLVMFAVSNDVVLCPMHVLPISRGGLLCESGRIEGDWRWPVLTIAHSSKADHDFTNKAGVFVQLPLFLLVDLGCTSINIAIAVQYGVLNYTALIQMCLCSAYACLKLYEAWARWELRRRLLPVWLRTACDHRMSAGRRAAAMHKYVAEGGDAKRLHQELALQTCEHDVGIPAKPLSRSSSDLELVVDTSDLGIPTVGDTVSAPGELEGDSLQVPWYRPLVEGDSRDRKHRSFVHGFLVLKEVTSDGLYGPKVHKGQVQYSLKLSLADSDSYPPPTFDRRVTLNNWQGVLTSCMLEAGLRNAGLQANVMMAVMMIENSVYSDMPYWLWIAFVAMLSTALLLWLAAGVAAARNQRDFVHPDSTLALARTFASAGLLSMFSMPNDVVLFPLHMLPLERGGLLCESGCILGAPKWPVHTLAHQSKLDHDYINTRAIAYQLPLFVLIDIGCTAANMWIAIEVGVFNFTALLQMCTCGAYAFVKLYEIYVRWRLRRKLLPIWLRSACDPCMSEARRSNALHKYLMCGGRTSEVVREARRSLHADGAPHLRASTCFTLTSDPQ